MSRINKPATPTEKAISNIEETERLIYFHIKDKHYIPREYDLENFIRLNIKILHLHIKTQEIMKKLCERYELHKSGKYPSGQ